MDSAEYYLMLKLSKKWKEYFGGISFNEFKKLVKTYSVGNVTGSKHSINEQDEENYEEELELDFTTLNKTVNEMKKRLDELEDDYMRKIGYGDHHQHPPPL